MKKRAFFQHLLLLAVSLSKTALATEAVDLGDKKGTLKQSSSAYRNSTGYAVKLPSVWKTATVESDEVFVIWPSPASQARFAPQIAIAYIPNQKLSNSEFDRSLDGKRTPVFRKDVPFQRDLAKEAEQLASETEPFVDDSTSSNHFWWFKFRCYNRSYLISYEDHLDRTERDKARKEHLIPKDLRTVIDGFDCGKP